MCSSCTTSGTERRPQKPQARNRDRGKDVLENLSLECDTLGECWGTFLLGREKKESRFSSFITNIFIILKYRCVRNNKIWDSKAARRHKQIIALIIAVIHWVHIMSLSQVWSELLSVSDVILLHTVWDFFLLESSDCPEQILIRWLTLDQRKQKSRDLSHLLLLV